MKGVKTEMRSALISKQYRKKVLMTLYEHEEDIRVRSFNPFTVLQDLLRA